MIRTPDQFRWTAANLLRHGEGDRMLYGEYAERDAEGRLSFSKGIIQPSAKEQQRRHEAYMAVLSARWSTWFALTANDSDYVGVPVGWITAAVRVAGERAQEALVALGPRRDWPGREIADATIEALLDTGGTQ